MNDSFISDIGTGFRSYDWDDFSVVSVTAVAAVAAVTAVTAVTAVAAIVAVIGRIRISFVAQIADEVPISIVAAGPSFQFIVLGSGDKPAALNEIAIGFS